MLELKVTLETVTPLFLSGVDPGGAPELRAPSVRGAMRYWLRAALGSAMGDRDLEALKQAESEVFGSTDGTGAVVVRVSHPLLAHEKMNPLPHKSTPARFDGFLAEQKFDLILTQRRESLPVWQSAIGALLLMVAFGGLGRRSRRGWGTVRIVHAQTQKVGLKGAWLHLLRFTPTSAKDWQAYLLNAHKAALAASRSLCKGLKIRQNSINPPTTFPVLGPTNPGLVCKTIYPKPEDAIRALGERMHSFGGGQAFGSADSRWASPLWVRVFPVKQASQGYVLAMVLLESESELADYERVRQFIGEWDIVQPEVQQ